MESNQAQAQQPVLTDESTFRFGCHENLPCFTQCCQDVNIYLTPYDVLRLRRALHIGSAELLDKYTRQFLAKGTNIPVVMFAMDPKTLRCQFVSDAGCQVYENRPWACRMYPLDLGSRSDEYCFIVNSERCKGLTEPKSWTVQKWLENQGVKHYVEMESYFHAVMPSGFKPGSRLDPAIGKILFMAYDLDRFATLLENTSFQKIYGLDEQSIRSARENDEEMLLMAYRYIRSQLEELLQPR